MRHDFKQVGLRVYKQIGTWGGVVMDEVAEPRFEDWWQSTNPSPQRKHAEMTSTRGGNWMIDIKLPRNATHQLDIKFHITGVVSESNRMSVFDTGAIKFDSQNRCHIVKIT